MREQLQQHSDMQLEKPCSTKKFCRHHGGKAGGSSSYSTCPASVPGRRDSIPRRD